MMHFIICYYHFADFGIAHICTLLHFYIFLHVHSTFKIFKTPKHIYKPILLGCFHSLLTFQKPSEVDAYSNIRAQEKRLSTPKKPKVEATLLQSFFFQSFFWPWKTTCLAYVYLMVKWKDHWFSLSQTFLGRFHGLWHRPLFARICWT